MILTIPDDVVLFTILNPEDKMTRKIVMENYINFYAYKDAVSGISYFRFEDFKNYENLDGVEKCLVPMNLIKENSNSLGFLLELLQTDYVISLPIVKKFIDFLVPKSISASNLVAALVPVEHSKEALDELNMLEQEILKRKEEILKSMEEGSNSSEV